MHTQNHLKPIMNSIHEGLTDNLKENISYLKAQMHHYQNHDRAPEILVSCLKLFDTLIPEEQQVSFQKLIRQTNHETGALLQKIRLNIEAQHYSTAQADLNPLLHKTETLNLFKDDATTEYRCFDELFEEILYRYYFQPSKVVKCPSIPYAEIYFLQGHLLSSLKEFQEAQFYYEKALQWNPTSFKILSAYIHCFKQTGDLPQMFRLALNGLKIAYRPLDIAQCFESLSLFYHAQKHHDAALACFQLSLRFKKDTPLSPVDQEMLTFFKDNVSVGLTDEEIRLIAETCGFPVGAHPEILQMAYHYGYHFLTEHQEALAHYFLSIAFRLDNDLLPKQSTFHFNHHPFKYSTYSS